MADLIEREKAIDALKAEVRLIDGYCCVDDRVIDESDAIEAINSIPSAQTEQKAGKWIKISPAGIYECSNCGQNIMTSDIDCYKWCHGCGAKMEEQDANGT